MPILHISVHNKIATYRQRDGGIVCGNSDYTISFSFDEEWDGYPNKVARFIWNGEFQDVGIEGDTCAVPVIQNANEVKVGVFAEELSTTTPATIACLGSILCVTATPSVENDGYWANDARDSAEVASEAATRSEEAADRAVAAVGFEASDFYNHESNRDNPHGVTPEQIGAVPTTRTINDKPLSADIMLTAADVAAAPAGFGLGETEGRFCKDANEATKVGFYYLNGYGCLNISDNFIYGVMSVERRNAYIYQTAKSADGFTECQVITRYSRDTGITWSEWEWVNPPMHAGVEYRTTERWQGKPVYALAVDLGSMPNNDLKDVYFNQNIQCENVISYEAVITSSDYGARGLPDFNEAGELRCFAVLLNSCVRIKSYHNLSSYTGKMTIKFTKE